MTPEQALALAPDAASAKAGRELAVLRKWQSPGRMGDTVIWGEMQGSGKTPYRTVVDLGAPAFNCSCPSRKFPCKHGLALLLLHVENGAGFGVADTPPEWAAKWLEGRVQRAEKKAVQAEARKNEEADPAAAEKRAAQRARRVADGLASLELWLLDLVRNGIGHAQAQPAEFWLQQSRRLVDAQAPGVATMVAALGEAAASGNGWQSRLLGGIGRLQLLIDGHRRLDDLSPELVADVRAQIGWTQSQDELREQVGLQDRWLVLGQVQVEDERLVLQRSWLRGLDSGRDALLLSFSHPSQPREPGPVPGSCVEGEMVFYPGQQPLRALLKPAGPAGNGATVPSGLGVAAAMDAFGAAIARQPWLPQYPLLLDAVVPVLGDQGNWLLEPGGDALPLARQYGGAWTLAALSGGRPLKLFGEWDGEGFLPLAAWNEGGRSPL